MLLGSLYAGMAFANSPCTGVHALAYPLGSHFHIAHGLANSLMLPHILRSKINKIKLLNSCVSLDNNKGSMHAEELNLKTFII